jgi:hypothetical protein
MDTDSINPNARGEGQARLPAIKSVRVKRARYAAPRRYFRGLQPVEAREGIEVLIETTEELPVRSLSPVAFIGEVLPDDAEVAGPKLYRFFFFDIERLQPGAPISFGFPNAPQLRIPTDFRFETGQPPLLA